MKQEFSFNKPLTESTVLIATTGIALFGLLLTHYIYQTTIDQIEEQNTLNEQTMSTQIALLEMQVAELSGERDNLSQELGDAENTLDAYENRIDDYRSDIKDLKKIVETDPELLQKYSKVYFLNEHYTPADLEDIDKRYIDSTKTNTLKIHEEVWPFLEDLLEDAEDDGVDLRVLSAYRSFGEQSQLKAQYSVVYGANSANQFSADQGYSEHQLGTTVDFTVAERPGQLSGFDTTEGFQWLVDNAYKYGFTLSYDKNNAYYIYEPWHWRFVGEDLARYINKKGATFYGLDQRDIDKYLGEIFD